MNIRYSSLITSHVDHADFTVSNSEPMCVRDKSHADELACVCACVKVYLHELHTSHTCLECMAMFVCSQQFAAMARTFTGYCHI